MIWHTRFLLQRQLKTYFFKVIYFRNHGKRLNIVGCVRNINENVCCKHLFQFLNIIESLSLFKNEQKSAEKARALRKKSQILFFLYRENVNKVMLRIASGTKH